MARLAASCSRRLKDVKPGRRPYSSAWPCSAFSAVWASRAFRADPEKQFRANFLGDLFQQIRDIRRDRVLWLAVLGNIYFSFVGALVLQNAILFGTDTLQVGEIKTSYLQVALAIGVGLGVSRQAICRAERLNTASFRSGRWD